MLGKIHEVSMPKWGMEMSEGTITEWRFSVGDQVNADDELVEIETSKIVNTLNSYNTGVLRRILAQPGETHPVGALIGVLAEGEVSDAEIDQFVASKGAATAQATAGPATAEQESAAPAPRAAAAAPPRIDSGRSLSQASAVVASASGTSAAAALSDADDSAVSASPVARRLAKKYGINLNNLSATGRHGRVSKRDVEEAVQRAGGQISQRSTAAARSRTRSLADDSQVSATPVARRLAKKLDVNLHDCRATGRRGRVSKYDVEAAHALFRAAEGLPHPSALDLAESVVAAASQVQERPLEGMRKTIAARLQSSKQTAPHYRVTMDVELDALLAVRRQINESNPEAQVSVNDFLIKACAAALVRTPKVNIQFDGTTIRQYTDADISIAVTLDNGLITPVVKKANTLGVIEISRRTRDLITRARLGTLKPHEFQGGTFSISNLGMYGVKQFDAIINPPQGAILAVGTAEMKPVVKDGQLAVATVMTLSLSSDHRVIDGVLAAEFLQALKRFLQYPASMLA